MIYKAIKIAITYFIKLAKKNKNLFLIKDFMT